jgi:aryl-alcohol dehydrogenase-like predicted oxidoreductase
MRYRPFGTTGLRVSEVFLGISGKLERLDGADTRTRIVAAAAADVDRRRSRRL